VSPGIEDYAALAKDAYHDRRDLVGTPKAIDVGGRQYYIRAAQSRPSGFQATAYQEAKPPHAIIIAYRGTQGLHDALVDVVLVADKVNPQEADARAFTERVLVYARQYGIPTREVTVTGHSLGGTLAEIEAWRFGLHGNTFNAYGAADLGYGVPQNGASVTNYVEALDVVSAAGHHFGQIVPLATPQDVTLLNETSLFGSRTHAIEIARRRALSAHSITNFAPDAGGASILTPDDAALAQTNIQAIGTYRNNIHALRSQIHVASEVPGNPVWTVSRTGEIADGLITAGSFLGHEAARGLHATGRLAEREATAALPGFSHFDHPQHAIYAALKERLPAGTSEARLAQAAAACHLAKLDKPEDLDQVYITDTKALFLNKSLFGRMAEVDLTKPAPAVEHSLQQVEQYDQQQQGLINQPMQHAHERPH
jgi:hypothetical protein